MDTYLPIDYQKSIAKQTLVYKTSTGLIFLYLFSAFTFIVPLIGPLIFIFAAGLHLSLFFIIFIIAFYCFAIINLLLLNFLVKIESTNPKSEREDIIKAISKYFKMENLDETKSGIVRDVRLYRTYKAGRAITCLLDENVIYLNVVRLTHLNRMNFLSGLFMFYKCKRIAKEFKKLQANSETAS